MSGRRPLFRSPKFGEGITSEAIEESGENVFIFARGRGSGTARRFESVPADANEPSAIWIAQTGQDNGNIELSKWSLTIRPRRRRCNPITGGCDVFWPSVCGPHHFTAGACG